MKDDEDIGAEIPQMKESDLGGVRRYLDELRGEMRGELGALRRDVADQMARVAELLRRQQRHHRCGECGELGHHVTTCKRVKRGKDEDRTPRPPGMGPQPAARRVRGRGKRVR